MKLKGPDIIFGGIVCAIAILLGIQLYWFKSQYDLARMQFERKATELLRQTMADLKKQNTCFEMYSKAYIQPGQGFVMLTPAWDTIKGFDFTKIRATDTVPMYFMRTHKDSAATPMPFSNLMFSTPTTADVTMRFVFQDQDSNLFYKKSKEFLNANDPVKAKEIISSSAPFFTQFDTAFIKRNYTEKLRAEQMPVDYELALVDIRNDSLVYHSAGSDVYSLRNSTIKQRLTDDDFFSNPYDVYVSFKDSNKSILGRMVGMLIVSAVILISLVLGFWYFIISIRRQKKLIEIKNDFINNLTHEFNTPIANISLAVETLASKRELDTEKRDKILAIIEKENNMLRDNVERILNLALMERHNISLKYEQVDLCRLIHNVLEGFEVTVQHKNATINFQCPDGSYIISADESHLISVFYNIIDNALKYSPAKPVITITLKKQANEVRISIADNGIGMSSEQVKHVFEKFYRVPKGDTHNVKGFGLGLTYVKLIVDAHKGHIEVNSVKGRGTTFEIYLPANFKP